MENIILKKFLTHENKGTYMPLIAGVFTLFYTVCGAISNQFAVILPMPVFEQNIPMLPWTIWIYIALYPAYIIWTLGYYKNEKIMNQLMYSFLLLTVISCAIFLIFPVTYPRMYFPISPDNSLTNMLFRGVRSIDKPSNCLPSLHVGVCYTLGLFYYRQDRTKFWIAMFISTIISISTITTKQHYIYDIVAGFGLAFLLFLFFDRKTVIKD